MLKLKTSLSSYVSRHSWATLALHGGVPVEVISESTGHENENTTRIYLASLDQSIIDRANKVTPFAFGVKIKLAFGSGGKIGTGTKSPEPPRVKPEPILGYTFKVMPQR
jgi:hypothetical protein